MRENNFIMAETATRNYDVKAVTRQQAVAYQSFGWIRSKEPVPEDLKHKSKQPLVLLKRKLEFGLNPKLSEYEKSYEKLEKKKYRSKPVLGIISFILMLAFIVLAGIELYFGVSAGLDKMKTDSGNDIELETDNTDNQEKTLKSASLTVDNSDSEIILDDSDSETADSSSSGILGQIEEILNKIKVDYLSKITSVFDGKTDENTGEYTPGIADNIASNLGAPISYFISADTFVGIIALVLAIIFIIIFARVCSIKKRRIAKEYKMASIREEAEIIVLEMRKSDLSLMGKTQRKQYLWESIITNAIRNANGMDDEDDDY